MKTLLEPCPKCKLFKTRFEFKWTFDVVGKGAYLEAAKKRFGKYIGKKLCNRCRRKLRTQDSNLWFAYNVIVPVLESEMSDKMKVKVVAALFGCTLL